MWLLGLSLSLVVIGLDLGSTGASSQPQTGQDEMDLSAVMYPLQHKARRKARMTKARTALIEEHGLKQSAEEVANAVREAQDAVARAAVAVGVDSEVGAGRGTTVRQRSFLFWVILSSRHSSSATPLPMVLAAAGKDALPACRGGGSAALAVWRAMVLRCVGGA